MPSSQSHAQLLEALSDKLRHHLTPGTWRDLFVGAGRDAIRFEQRPLTLVHIESDLLDVLAPEKSKIFIGQLQDLVARHNGLLDRFTGTGALASFEEPEAALHLAMDVQRIGGPLSLRIGVVSGLCTVCLFELQGVPSFTVLGAQPTRAARIAAKASGGSIVMSPTAYEPVEDLLAIDSEGCMVMEEFVGEGMAQASVTFAPHDGFSSTFAGLGTD